jgi:hypothetical protein
MEPGCPLVRASKQEVVGRRGGRDAIGDPRVRGPRGHRVDLAVRQALQRGQTTLPRLNERCPPPGSRRLRAVAYGDVVKYASASAFRTALETRLKNEQSEGVGFSRLRKRVVFERLLARLQAVAPEGWFLKGGFALDMVEVERGQANQSTISYALQSGRTRRGRDRRQRPGGPCSGLIRPIRTAA